MKKVGKLAIMLSLVAIAPSFAEKNNDTNEIKKTTLVKKTADTKQSAKITKTYKPIDASHFKGLEHKIVFVDNRNCNDGDGSCLHPFPTLASAQENSKPGQIIYVIATGIPYTDESDYVQSPAVITLQPSQSLVSSGCALKIGDKQIPATTPDQFAEILIDGANTSVGVILTNCNQVSGFIFSGPEPANIETATETFGITANRNGLNALPSITNSGAGGKNYISRNLFQNLNYGIELEMQGWSSVEIFSNRFNFSQGLIGVFLKTTDGDMANIHNNSFEGSMKACIASFPITTSVTGEKISLSKQIENITSERNSSPSVLNASNSSDAAELFIEENQFKCEGTYGIITEGTKKVVIRKNHASAGLFNGFSITQISPIQSKIDIEENTFDLKNNNLLHLNNVHLEAKHNTFLNGRSGLEIYEANGSLICIEENYFKNHDTQGFFMIGGTVDAPACLRFVKNRMESNADYTYRADIELDNISDPSSFLVEVRNPSNGEQSLSQANFNASVEVQAEPVKYVKHCPKCHEHN